MAKERSLNDMDEEQLQMVADNWRCLSRIDKLIDVTDCYRETLRLIAYRVMANPTLRMHLYIFAQLSEMGTGFNGTFENGGMQSDRRDDVIMWFSSLRGGLGFRMRLRADDLSLLTDGDGKREPIRRIVPLHDIYNAETRVAICAAVDDMFRAWWEG